MTLQEAKNQIAKRYGYPDWECIDWYQVDYSLDAAGLSVKAQDELIQQAVNLIVEEKDREIAELQNMVNYLQSNQMME